ncbi:MAG: hypothetical protein EOP51_10690, partial [Sphingobacteriales bacterium]
MRAFIYKILLLLFVGASCMTTAYAQKKKPEPAKQEIAKPSAKKDTTITYTKSDSAARKTVPPLATKGVDTVIIIDKKTGKPIDPKITAVTKTPTRKPDTIIYIDATNNKPKPPAATTPVRDTVIVLRKGKQSKELLKNLPKTEVIKVVKVPEVCGCVT